MTGLVVGLDIGGTKTALRAVTPDEEIVYDAVVPSSGWNAEPAESAAAFIDRVIQEQIGEKSVVALGIGAQGLDNLHVISDLESALRGLDYDHVRCVNDAALLVPAAGVSDGIGLIAGTGAIGVGRDAEGHMLKAGGWGWVIGDDAGGAGIVREAVKSALLADDDGLPDDGLLEVLLTSFGVPDAERLARAVNDEPTLENWAPHAPQVFAAADAGSQRAAAVIDRAAAHLVRLVSQLIAHGATGNHVVAAGSVIVSQPRLSSNVQARLATIHPDMTFTVLHEPPVAGAVAIARTRLANSEEINR